MEDIDDDSQSRCGADKTVRLRYADDGYTNSEEEVHVRVCLSNDKYNKESLHDGALAGTENRKVRLTREPANAHQTESNIDRDNPVCPIQIFRAEGDKEGGHNSDDPDRPVAEDDYNVIVEQLSPRAWGNEVRNRLISLRSDDKEGDLIANATPKPHIGDEDLSDNFVKDVHPESCTQCPDLDTSIEERHYYTHVRSIIICDDEPLSKIDIDNPRVIDTFSSGHAYQLALWQNKNREMGLQVEERLPYWTTPYFLLGLIMQVRHRLTNCFPFNIFNNTKYSWKATPILLSYTSKEGLHASISTGNMLKDVAITLPEPAHELVHMVSKPSTWYGAAMNVWIHVEIKAIPYPQEIVTSAEDKFLKRIRQLLGAKDNPMQTMAYLIQEFNTLKDEKSVEDNLTDAINNPEEIPGIVKLTWNRHAAIRRAINSKLGKIREFSISRNGSQKLLSTPEEDKSLTVQMAQRRKDMLRKNRQLHKTSPKYKMKKRNKSPTITSAHTVKPKPWIKSTPFSKKSYFQQQEELRLWTNQSQNGKDTTKPQEADWSRNLSNLAFIQPKGPNCKPNKGPQPLTFSNMLKPDQRELDRQDQQWNPYKALLREQQERMMEIKTYPRIDQLFYLNRITNPHPEIRSALRAEKRLLTWQGTRGLLPRPAQTVQYNDWPTETLAESGYRIYKKNLEDLRNKI